MILVTGASGFIGRMLCQALQRQGASIRALMRCETQGPWNEIVVGDLTKPLPEQAMLGMDTVFHLAGKAHALSETKQGESEYYQINVDGTKQLLQSAKDAGVTKFVFFSSVKAMGEGGESIAEDDCQLPKTPYGKSKLEAEHLVLGGGYVPHPVVLRLSMVYGSSRKGNLPKMINAVAKRRFPPLAECGNRRSMVHVDDVVQAAMLAAQIPAAAGKVYTITDGQPYSTRQIYEWICEVLGKPVPSWHVPLYLLKALAVIGDGIGKLRNKRFIFDSDAMEKLVGSACYNSDLIEKELGYVPQRNLRDSLKDMSVQLGLV